MQGAFFLNVVVRQRAAIFQLLASEDQALLIWRNAFFVLNFGLDIVDSIAGLNVQSDGLTGQGFHEDLHASAKAQDEMQGAFLLNVVVGQRAAILELLAGKDQTLLIWRNAFFILNFGLDIVDSIAGL